jgi:hypothetical protein
MPHKVTRVVTHGCYLMYLIAAGELALVRSESIKSFYKDKHDSTSKKYHDIVRFPDVDFDDDVQGCCTKPCYC